MRTEREMLLRGTAVHLDVGDLFPGVMADLTSLHGILRRLPLTETLFWCARVNLFVSGFGPMEDKERQQLVVNELLTQREVVMLNRTAARARSRVMPFCRGQMLELLRWAALWCHPDEPSGRAFERSEVRLDFAKAALIASGLLGERTEENVITGLPDGEPLSDHALPFVRKSVEAAAVVGDLWRYLGRARRLFGRYFPRYYETADRELASRIGLTVEEYLLCAASLVPSYLTVKGRPSLINVDRFVPEGGFRLGMSSFFAAEAQTPHELRTRLWPTPEAGIPTSPPEYDQQALRRRPILRTEKGQAIILDPRFYSEKLLAGPVFHLVEGQSAEQTRRIFGSFGNALEKYTCASLSKAASNDLQAADLQFQADYHGQDHEGKPIQVDALLRFRRQLVVFEIKSVFLREDRISAREPEAFLEYLDEKYVAAEGQTARQTHRAIEQLVRFADLLASRRWTGNNAEFSNLALVYPVLVVHDSLLNAPLFGRYFARQFSGLLQPDQVLPSGLLQKGGLRVSPLVTLTVNDVEDLEDSVAGFGFLRLLEEYSLRCPARELSLHDYAAHTRYRTLMCTNATLAAESKELLRDVGLRLFGKDIDAENTGSGSR